MNELIVAEPMHTMRLCEVQRKKDCKEMCWFHKWHGENAIVEFEGGRVADVDLYSLRFLDTPPFPEMPPG